MAGGGCTRATLIAPSGCVRPIQHTPPAIPNRLMPGAAPAPPIPPAHPCADPRAEFPGCLRCTGLLADAPTVLLSTAGWRLRGWCSCILDGRPAFDPAALALAWSGLRLPLDALGAAGSQRGRIGTDQAGCSASLGCGAGATAFSPVPSAGRKACCKALLSYSASSALMRQCWRIPRLVGTGSWPPAVWLSCWRR